MNIKTVTIKHTGIKSFDVSGSVELPRFVKLTQNPMSVSKRKDLGVDTIQCTSNSHFRYVKVTILSAYSPFVTVHNVSCD